MSVLSKLSCQGWSYYTRCNELLKSLNYTALNACVLAGQIFPRIPRFIPNAAQSCLAYVGVLYLPYSLREIKGHTLPLLKDAYEESNHLRVALTVNKLVGQLVGVAFTLGGLLISSSALAGYPKLQEQWYSKTLRLSKAIAIASIANSIFDSIALQAYRHRASRTRQLDLKQRRLMPLRQILGDYWQTLYFRYLKPPVKWLSKDLHRSIKLLCRSREAKIKGIALPPSRSQLRAIVDLPTWERWEQKPQEALRDLTSPPLLPGLPFALSCFDSCAFKIAKAYPQTMSAWMLASSALHSFESYLISKNFDL